ncbi:unnamed protein product [Sympodiomycopsis kandeliae]
MSSHSIHQQQQQQQQQISHKMSSNEEQSFSIQPHPATTNDPNTDPALNESSAQGSDPKGKPGVHVPNDDIVNKLETPKSKEELAELSAKLNQ